jgi:hypothetical protein
MNMKVNKKKCTKFNNGQDIIKFFRRNNGNRIITNKQKQRDIICK